MKDVTSCDKLRGTANRSRSVDFRMRERTTFNRVVSLQESNTVLRGTQGTEPSKYLEEEKEISIF